MPSPPKTSPEGGAESSTSSTALSRNSTKQRHRSTSQQTSTTDPSPSTNSNSTTTIETPSTTETSSSTTEKAAAQDAQDFFARAKAMGLNLTRQDYERARAGVSAFLRAQRVDKGDDAVGESSSGGGIASSSSNTNASHDAQGTAERSPAIPASGSASAKIPSHSKLSNRSTSSPMLSFFTAVVPSEEDEIKARPRLDEVSTMEERRRRKEKRRKIKERLESLALLEGADDSTTFSASHAKKSSLSSTILEESPMTNISTETPIAPLELCNSSLSSSQRLSKIKLLSNASLQGQVGLGLQMTEGTGVDDSVQEEQTVEGMLESPVQLSSSKPVGMILESPGLKRLSQKAHIDTDGRLTLLSTPDKRLEDVDVVVVQQPNHDVSNEEEDNLATTNAGADTDDSGVFFGVEAVSSKKEWGRSSRRRRSSSNSSSDTTPPLDLHESLNRLSFLDRVMAQKASPIRLRREAKARELEAQRAKGQHDVVIMTATTSALPSLPPSTSSSTFQAPALPPSKPSEKDRVPETSRLLESQLAKNVRWANDSSSPRKRMTTKEHYDFAFYGIAPHVDTTNNIPTFDDEAELKRNSTEAGTEEQTFHLRQRTTSVWMRNHLPASNFGSPVATRGSGSGGSTFQSQDSPGVLSLNLESMSDRLEGLGIPALSAKRGLLFGPSSTDRTPPSLSNLSSLELADSGFSFSQGPTLARSPARNVFETFTTSTPPKFVRSNTLAAPFSLHQQTNMGEEKVRGVEDSPDRVMLMRAHSSGALERRLPSQSRLSSQFAREEDKENIPMDSSSSSSASNNNRMSKRAPNGWAHRSPMGKYETISPAAIFGMSSSQPRLRIHSGESSDFGSLGRVNPEPNKLQQRAKIDEVNSDEEGDDEREMETSPAYMDSTSSNRHFQTSPTRMLGRKGLERNHTRESSASTSVFEDSPLYLDVHNRTASIVSTLPSSSSSLASALGMNPSEHGEERGSSQNTADQSFLKGVKAKKKKKKQQQQQQNNEQQEQQHQYAGQVQAVLLQQQMNRPTPQDESVQSNKSMAPVLKDGTAPHGRMEWDKPDGSRVVKLISEELQAALEGGTLTTEPPARYYKLPPDWGKSSAKPQSVSYAGMIGQAILSSSDGRLSLNEIYNWISTVFPFFERGDRGWQNSIRHNLSLNKSFIKVERDANVPGKGGWWAIKEGHENRFKAGSYVAPGSTTSHKVAKDGNPKTPKNQSIALDTMQRGEGEESQREEEGIADSGESASSRRKRQGSERSDVASENPSESDSHPSLSQTKANKKSKKVKLVGGLGKKIRNQVDSPSFLQSKLPKVGLQAPTDQQQHSTRVPLRPVQSSSPRDAPFETITPSRSHHFLASSGHGSTSTTSMMANMPMLTDASSPPSSPNNFDSLMPPPSGGVQGAASSQSARKRKQAVSRAVELMNGSLSMAAQQGSIYNSQNVSFVGPNGNHISSHTLQASPLAHMRGNSGNVNGSTLSSSNARLRAGPGHSLINAMDSPLRRHGNNVNANGNGNIISNSSSSTSPSRLFVNSPVSSMRGSASHEQSGGLSMERSTTDEAMERGGEGEDQVTTTTKTMASPLRGSPLRSGSQFAGWQPSNMFLSPAGMHLQMALGQQAAAAAANNNNNNTAATMTTTTNGNSGASQFLNFGAGNTPNRYTDQNNGNFLYQRWGLSPSPTKPLRFPMNNTGNLYSQNGTPTHASHLQGHSNSNLDDPFDYSGNLQHELELASDFGQLASADGTDSPMKMAYPTMNRSHLYSGAIQQLAPQQQQQQQQQQPGHQLHYGHTPSYAINLAASNIFAHGPNSSYKSTGSD